MKIAFFDTKSYWVDGFKPMAEKYGYEPIKYMMIQAHYRMPLNYTLTVIESAKITLAKMIMDAQK